MLALQHTKAAVNNANEAAKISIRGTEREEADEKDKS
jgi:hypothetical protein